MKKKKKKQANASNLFPQFVSYYAKDDQIMAVASIGRDPAVAKSTALIRLNQMPKLSEIKAGKNILEINISGKIGN
jgi:apoptosis-inducing factor 3